MYKWSGDLFILDAEGEVTQFTETPDLTEWCPRWSPEGKQIACQLDDDVIVFDVHEKTRTPVTTDGQRNWNPARHPLGRSVAFCSGSSGNFELMMMAVDGTEIGQLTDGARDEGMPDWTK